MQFFTLAALFGAAAMAAPAPQTPDCPNPAHCGDPSDPSTYENIDFSDYALRRNNGTVEAVSFKISGNNATDLLCRGGPYPTLPSNVEPCGDSKYRFGIYQPDNSTEFGVRIYHELGLATGFWGEGVVPTQCHGGNGVEDFVCQQSSYYTLVISATG